MPYHFINELENDSQQFYDLFMEIYFDLYVFY